MNPHKCPIFLGSGKVPVGFYNWPIGNIETCSSCSFTEKCRQCDGNGILWEPLKELFGKRANKMTLKLTKEEAEMLNTFLEYGLIGERFNPSEQIEMNIVILRILDMLRKNT